MIPAAAWMQHEDVTRVREASDKRTDTAGFRSSEVPGESGTDRMTGEGLGEGKWGVSVSRGQTCSLGKTTEFWT